MAAKYLLQDIADYMKEKHKKTGITFTDRLDGILSSTVSVALNIDGKQRTFRIGITETDKKLGE